LLGQGLHRERPITRFLADLIKAEAGLVRSGKLSARVTTTKEAPITEMPGSDGQPIRVRKLGPDELYAPGWVVEVFGRDPVDPTAPVEWRRQAGGLHRTRREAAAWMARLATIGVVRH